MDKKIRTPRQLAEHDMAAEGIVFLAIGIKPSVRNIVRIYLHEQRDLKKKKHK